MPQTTSPGRHWKALFLLIAVALAGCAGNGAGLDSQGLPEVGVFRDGDRIVSSQSGLVLQLPEGLPANVADARLVEVYNAVLARPECQGPGGQAVDFLTAETCDLYHRFYLYPENLPASLEGISTPQDYVARLRQTDPFTSYSAPASFQQVVLPSLQGERATIGFRFRLEGTTGVAGPEAPFVVTGIVPYTRAWFDGLQVGDQIVEVDGQAVAGLTVQEIQALLPTAEGKAVVLGVDRNGVRETIRTASEVHIAFPLGDDVAYLNVRQFTTVTGDRVREDLEALRAASPAPLDRVILDLRGDGGGSVQGALALTDYLVDRDVPPKTNPILTFNGTTLHNSSRYLGDYLTVNLLPDRSPANLAVIVDGGTASACEIVVAALRDYGVVTVVGAKSFGKGVRQDLYQLVDNAGLIITSNFILSPLGRSYHGVGIEPDIPALEAASPSDDPGITAALTWLRTGAAPVAAAREGAPRAPAATEGEPELEPVRGAVSFPGE